MGGFTTQPSHVVILLCEDVREEKSGQITLVGLYPSTDITVQVKDTSKPAKIERFTFVCMLKAGEGHGTVSFELRSPSGKSHHQSKFEGIRLVPAGSGLIVMRVNGFEISEFGSWSVVFKLGDREYTEALVIRKHESAGDQA